MLNRHFAFIAVATIAVDFVTAAPVYAANHVVLAAAKAAATRDIPMFDDEAAAQAHCPSETPVWLNMRTGIYRKKGVRWYGRTKRGAYVCKKEADAAAYRDTRNANNIHIHCCFRGN